MGRIFNLNDMMAMKSYHCNQTTVHGILGQCVSLIAVNHPSILTLGLLFDKEDETIGSYVMSMVNAVQGNNWRDARQNRNALSC